MGASSQTEAARRFGKYTLIEKLGEGYLGPVYRGFDQDLGRAAVIRILCDDIKWDEQLEAHFQNECNLVANLHHPNIAAFFEVGKEGQSRFIVMESLGSSSLESIIACKSPISVEAKLSIMIRVAEGLSYAHKNGILHRNLSPGKIHLTPESNVKIRDFGIANILMKHLPHPVVRWGDPIYLSPEQIQQKICNEQSDIFSAGLIFYELLTFIHPFHDRNSNKVLDNIILDTQVPTFDQFPDAPPGIWSILKTCLARDPNDRYQSMDELSNACGELLRDLAEDTRFMLAELHAAHSALKKAATLHNVPESTSRFLQEIQELLKGDREADYVSLDRLMTVLIDQYPVIQSAAGELSKLDDIPLRIAREEAEGTAANKNGLASSERTAEPGECVSSAQTPQTDPASVGAGQILESAPLQPTPAAENETSEDSDNEAEQETAIPQEHKADAEFNGDNIEPDLDELEGMDTAIQNSPELPFTGMVTANSLDASSADCRESPVDIAQGDPITGMGSSRVARNRSGRSRIRLTGKLSYRFVVVLLSILLIAVAIYIMLGTNAAAFIRGVWKNQIKDSSVAAASATQPWLINDEGPLSTLLKEAHTLAVNNRYEESKVLIRRILEVDPNHEAAIIALNEVNAALALSDTDGIGSGRQPPPEQLTHVSDLIKSGKLRLAKVEIDKLQQRYPDSPKIDELRRIYLSGNSRETIESGRSGKAEEQQKATRDKKEAEWKNRLTEYFSQGNYGEASSILNTWLEENPESSQAKQFIAEIKEIQFNLRVCASALSEKRYQDALEAIGRAEKINPADSSLTEMRRRIEARKAEATATLTVHRLGEKASLLLDGKSIGNDGEIESERIAIGNHTLAIESSEGFVASWQQEFLEGQEAAFVYDAAEQSLRPMTEADRELLVQRKEMEKVHRFVVEHKHGVFRGSCRGEILVNYFELIYKPYSGTHGFQIPAKAIKVGVDGKSMDLIFVLDNQTFESFKFQDATAAERFRQTWSQIRALGN